MRHLLGLPPLLAVAWADGVGAAGQPVVDLFVPLAGNRGLRLHLYRAAPGLPFWLNQGGASLHYALDASGGEPFQDADLRRFLLALGNRFRTSLRRQAPEWIEAQLVAAGL